MDRELLLRLERLAVEPARLALGRLVCILVAVVHLLPGRVAAGAGRFGPIYRLRELVLAYEVVEEVVAPEALVAAVADVARLLLEVAVPFVLVADLVGLALEHLKVIIALPSTGKGLDVLVHVLGPVRRLLELLGHETQLALKLGRYRARRRYRDALGEALRGDSPF